jgi:hypothetical protein
MSLTYFPIITTQPNPPPPHPPSPLSTIPYTDKLIKSDGTNQLAS